MSDPTAIFLYIPTTPSKRFLVSRVKKTTHREGYEEIQLDMEQIIERTKLDDDEEDTFEPIDIIHTEFNLQEAWKRIVDEYNASHIHRQSWFHLW